MGEEIVTLILENKTNDSFFKILLINFNKIKTNIFKIEEYDLNCLSITLPSNAKNLLNFKEKKIKKIAEKIIKILKNNNVKKIILEKSLKPFFDGKIPNTFYISKIKIFSLLASDTIMKIISKRGVELASIGIKEEKLSENVRYIVKNICSNVKEIKIFTLENSINEIYKEKLFKEIFESIGLALEFVNINDKNYCRFDSFVDIDECKIIAKKDFVINDFKIKNFPLKYDIDHLEFLSLIKVKANEIPEFEFYYDDKMISI